MANWSAEISFTSTFIEGSAGQAGGQLFVPGPTLIQAIGPQSRAEQPLTYAGGTTVTYPTRVLPDSNDLIVWMFDDPVGSTSVKNAGTTSTDGNLPFSYGAPVLGSPGLFGSCLMIQGTGTNGFHSANDTSPAVQPTDVEPAFPVTWSGWVYLRSNAVNNSAPVAKAYRRANEGWSSPFNMNLCAILASGINWQASFVVSGSQVVITSPRRFNVNVWHHVGWTYDGSTFILYMDGDEVARQSQTGAIDYGNHGPFYVGGNYINSDDRSAIMVQDFRMANIARAHSYFQSVYQKGYTQFGA